MTDAASLALDVLHRALELHPLDLTIAGPAERGFPIRLQSTDYRAVIGALQARVLAANSGETRHDAFYRSGTDTFTIGPSITQPDDRALRIVVHEATHAIADRDRWTCAWWEEECIAFVVETIYQLACVREAERGWFSGGPSDPLGDNELVALVQRLGLDRAQAVVLPHGALAPLGRIVRETYDIIGSGPYPNDGWQRSCSACVRR